MALRLEVLSKRYRLGASRERYATLRDAIAGAGRAPVRWLKRGVQNGDLRYMWALRELDLEVRSGELVGVIGRNGAGKSTLLKIIAGITKPTSGSGRVWGRLSSLLEVGTGFHPELTGRENIYLNGAILGMRRHEVRQKFDEIVEFAEIGRFLDTPVKRYSSGMYLRLAFAVAAHLEPEILLVDEVLAVGDIRFQRKCLGKMAEVGSTGRTVLFVSHDMQAVLRLCPRAVLLHEGQKIADGAASEVVRNYLDAGYGSSAERTWNPNHAPGDEEVQLVAARVRDQAGNVTETIDIRRPVAIEVEWRHLRRTLNPSANLHFFNDDGVCLFVSNSFNNPDWRRAADQTGLVRSTCRLPGNFLAEGRVSVLVAVSSHNPTTVIHAMERDAVAFQVIDQTEGDGVRGEWSNHWPGVVRPMLEWSIEVEPEHDYAVPMALRQTRSFL